MRMSPILAVALFATAAPAFASSAFIVAQRVGKPTIVMAEISTDEAYDITVVKTVQGYDAAGKPAPVQQIPMVDHVVLKPATAVATIVLVADFGFHARPAASESWQLGRKSQLPGTDVGLHAIKESVNLLADAPAALHPHGLQLEIVPLADPLKLHRGDTLPVRVLFHGKPLAGVRLQENFLNTAADQAPATGADGRTMVMLHADQFNVVQLTYEDHVKNDPDVDFFRYNAALTFTLTEAKN